MVVEAPLPVVVTPPGERVKVQLPEGKPLNTTLPLGTAHVGWVGVPATGAEGAEGAALMVNPEVVAVHVLSVVLLTVTLWVEEGASPLQPPLG